MSPGRKEYTTPEDKKKDFWIGFGLFWGVNILVWGLTVLAGIAVTDWSNSGKANDVAVVALGPIIALLPWVINVGVLIWLARTRSQMALGMLIGFAVVLGLTVLLFIVALVACFVALGTQNTALPLAAGLL